MTVPKREVELLFALSTNVHRLFGLGDLNTIHRRLDGWSEGVQSSGGGRV